MNFKKNFLTDLIHDKDLFTNSYTIAFLSETDNR